MDRTSYDSTWEEDDDDSIAEKEWSTTKHVKAGLRNTQAHEAARLLKTGRPIKFRYEYMYSSAARDMQNYRHGYRNSWSNLQGDSEGEMPNLYFFRNQIEFQPNGYYIDKLLTKWKDDYASLEYNHNYIQWLFPLRERGLNPHASPLREQELQIMKEDPKVRMRLLEAYKLMLGFYGLHLRNENTGEVCRAKNWKERYENLNNNTHNNLRITRILKCLGEMGFQHYQAPLVQLFLEETLCERQLNKVKRSVLDYFVYSVKDKRERQNLLYFAWRHYEPQSMFIWGPVDLLRNYKEVLKEHQREDYDIISKKFRKEDNNEDTKETQRKTNKDDRTQIKRKDRDNREEDVIKHRKKIGKDGVNEHQWEETQYKNQPWRDNREDDRKDEKIGCGMENSQQGVSEYGRVEAWCNYETQREDNGDDRTKCKTEDNKRHFEKKNGQDDMKVYGQAESTFPTKSQRQDSGGHRRTYKMEDMEVEKIKSEKPISQDNMKDDVEGETPYNMHSNTENHIKLLKIDSTNPCKCTCLPRINWPWCKRK